MNDKQLAEIGRWAIKGWAIDEPIEVKDSLVWFRASRHAEESYVSVYPDGRKYVTSDDLRIWANNNLPGYHLASFTRLPQHGPKPEPDVHHYKRLANYWRERYITLLEDTNND